jgi:hypothetical protein
MSDPDAILFLTFMRAIGLVVLAPASLGRKSRRSHSVVGAGRWGDEVPATSATRDRDPSEVLLFDRDPHRD